MADPKKDAFDLWWERAEKPADSMLMTVEIHDAVMALLAEERRDRTTVNNAVRNAQSKGL